MARNFTGIADHLDNAVPAVTALTTGMSMCAWVKFNTLLVTQDVLTLGQAANGNNRWSIGQSSLSAAHCTARDGAASSITSSSSLMSAGVWSLLTGIFSDDTNRASYLNGANKGTSAVLRAITAPAATRVSGQNAAGANTVTNALIAHVAIWNTILTDADVLALYTNAPSSVQVGFLQEYWPLTSNTSPEPSIGILGNTLTVTGTTFNSDDPYGFPPLLMGQAIF